MTTVHFRRHGRRRPPPADHGRPARRCHREALAAASRQAPTEPERAEDLS